MKLNTHIFLFYFIGLLLAVYQGFSEEYIILFFCVILFISKWNSFSHVKIRNLSLYIFFFYYFLLTIFGALVGNTEYNSIIIYIITFVLLPVTIRKLVNMSVHNGISALNDLKILICISAIYGFVESIIKYNVLYEVINIPARDWIISMNNTFRTYQPSSFFLHYTYYGNILLIGIMILLLHPFKLKFMNICFFLLLSEQIFVAQSRICWIAYIVLIFLYLKFSQKVSLNKLSKKIVLGFLMIVFLVIGGLLFQFDLLENFIRSIINRFSTLFIYGFEDGSLGQRLGTLMNWPLYLRNNIFDGIFGTGFSSITNVFLNDYSYFKGYNTADCQYTTILVETGLLGFILFIISIAKFIKKNWNKKTKQGLLFILCMITYAIECVTYNITTYFVIVPLFLVISVKISEDESNV